MKEIRPLLEYVVPVWNSGLSLGQIHHIERVQKIALKIILEQTFTSYHEACTQFNIENLALFVCLLMWWAGDCSITESPPKLIQQVRQDLAGALGDQP